MPTFLDKNGVEKIKLPPKQIEGEEVNKEQLKAMIEDKQQVKEQLKADRDAREEQYQSNLAVVDKEIDELKLSLNQFKK